jgi:hypothetical protein
VAEQGEKVTSKDLKDIALSSAVDWQYSAHSKYEFHAVISGVLMSLRLNDFPEETLCTLIIEDVEFHIDSLPQSWTLPKHRGEDS